MELANLFLKDEQLSTMETLGALRIHAGFQSNRAVLTNRLMEDVALLRSTFYYWQFAEAAYGWMIIDMLKFERGFSGLAQGMRSSPDEALRRYCKLGPDDILHSSWESKPALPVHFLVRDARTRSLIWGIRGSFSVHDVITDLVAVNVPFLGGVAHKGLLLCVENLMETVWPAVEKQLSEHAGYGLVLVGHSLGAAVAAMLAMSLTARYPKLDVACWAFACPPCVSLDLAKSSRPYVYCVSYGEDVITRLSLDAIVDLRNRLRAIAKAGEAGFYKAWTEGLAASAQAEEKLSQMGFLSEDRMTWISERDCLSKPGRLFSPSRHLYIYKVGSNYYAEETTCQAFNSIIVSNNAFHDHLPTTYNAALVGLLARIKREQSHTESPVKVSHLDVDIAAALLDHPDTVEHASETVETKD